MTSKAFRNTIFKRPNISYPHVILNMANDKQFVLTKTHFIICGTEKII